MFSTEVNIGDVAYAVQLALTPVFLLTGIAGILNVMTGRLSRIIDRGRYLTESVSGINNTLEALQKERLSLERRRHIASTAITMSTFSALLVCMVTATLFLEALLQLSLKWLVGLFFTGSTLALVVGLAYFLWEVRLATSSVRIPELTEKL
ncbi:MAG: hypothetical protein COB23_00970 [Methylophaga sp.]|nr:MAG: hypothetical protein COB23_00970 [Methylophaga sp.]